MIHLDTHVAVWMHERRPKKLSRTATRAMAGGTLVVSPVVSLELSYLRQSNRLQSEPEEVIADLRLEFGVEVSNASFLAVCDAAARIGWTRDVFDRLIVANALVDQASLVTADNAIADHFKAVVW